MIFVIGWLSTLDLGSTLTVALKSLVKTSAKICPDMLLYYF
jgi:hypothetical protein